MTKPDVPSDLTQVDAGWLEAALRAQSPDLRIAGCEQAQVIHGAATKMKLRVEYLSNPDGLPTELWVKGGWEPHSEWLAGMGTYTNEALFYREFKPRVPVATPRCFFSAAAPNGNSVVVLEDLRQRGARLDSCIAGVPVAQMYLSLENLARLHARWWNDPEIDDHPAIRFPMRADDSSSDWPRRNGPDVMREFFDKPRGAVIPSSVKDAERIDRAFWKMLHDMPHARPFVLLHGDPHPNNTYVDADGAPGLYDWQTLSKGPWAYDVAYHMVTSLSVGDRRRHDRDLIRHYLECVAAHGVARVPTYDEAWNAVRGYIAYSLHIWLTNPEPFQSEESCAAMMERLGAAAEDYDFFERWGV